MIKLENVSKYYSSSGNVALGLHNVTCELNKGEIISIVGESGSGKSTFLNVVCSIDSFEEGEIYYGDEPVSGYSPDEIERFRKNHIGFIFQNYNIIDSYTVLQNVMLPLLLRGVKMKDAKKQALEIINRVGLGNRVKNRGSKLSGGEKQRTVIARALASNSDILACDEPTGNLDSHTGKEIMRLIKEVSKDKLVLIVSHNAEEVNAVATRTIRFHDGEIVEDRVLSPHAEVENDSFTSDQECVFKLKEKTKVSLLTLAATPKKLVFLLAVYFSVAFFVAILCANFLSIKVEGTSWNSTYSNTSPNRIIGFNFDGSEVDVTKIEDKLKTKVIKNSYFEDASIPFNFNNFPAYPITHLDYDDIDLCGEKPEEDEVIIGGTKEQLDRLKSMIGVEMSYISCLNETVTLTVSGCFVYDGVENHTVKYFVYGDAETNYAFQVYSWLRNFYIFDNANGSLDVFSYLDNSAPDDQIIINIQDDASLYTPQMLNVTFSIFGNEFYDDNVRVVIQGNQPDCSMKINVETITKLIQKHVFQFSVYANNSSDTIEKIEKLGYEAHRANDVGVDDMFSILVQEIVLIFVLFFCLIGVVIVFFISYAILSWIYSSKIRDYQIFRTLGTSRKDMCHIVIIETEFLSLSTTLLLLIINGIFKYFDLNFIPGFDAISPVMISVFILAMIIVSYLFAHRFNRKLFKFTIQSSLKKEALSND